MKKIKTLTFEISLKAFKSVDDDSIRDIFKEIFRHWYSLTKHAETISFLFWTGDGTELLEYSGDQEKTFDWGKWVGFAKSKSHLFIEIDPQKESIVTEAKEYKENSLDLKYSDLKKIVRLLKETGAQETGKPIRAGTVLDPGQEFVKSDFKFSKHPEIIWKEGPKLGQNVDCTSKMHADGESYAGFPDGIPEGISFGQFMGRQAQHFMADMGFDYIWFSNSFGFGRCPYAYGGLGQFFNGETFSPEGNKKVRDKIIGFWKDFRAECPDFQIQTRGTDFPVGMNWVNHATPYKELYEGDFNIIPPPNTPWSALTNNYGVSLTGYMGRIAAFPGDFPYRFYANDPWWCNTPWVDRFEKSPHDMFMSLSVSRIDETGAVKTPDYISVLTMDDSWGDISEQIPDEVIPQLKEALKHTSDCASPFVWIYPFNEYNQMTFEDTDRMDEVFAGDILIQEAINNALPLNTVVTTENFMSSRRINPSMYDSVVLFTPVPQANSAFESELLEHLSGGGRVLLYGSLKNASEKLLALLDIHLADPLSGEFDVEFSDDRRTAKKMLHQPSICAGGISEVPTGASEPLYAATAEQSGEKRIVTLVRHSGEGTLGWVRGSSSIDQQNDSLKKRSLLTFAPEKYFKAENLFRYALSQMGHTIELERGEKESLSSHIMTTRNQNAYYFSLFSPERGIKYRLRFPHGAPIFTGEDAELKNGRSVYTLNKFMHKECRVFVRQEQDATITCHRNQTSNIKYKNRIIIKNLEKATLCFYPVSDDENRTQVLLNPHPGLLVDTDPFESKWKQDGTGRYIEIKDVTGTMSFAW